MRLLSAERAATFRTARRLRLEALGHNEWHFQCRCKPVYTRDFDTECRRPYGESDTTVRVAVEG